MVTTQQRLREEYPAVAESVPAIRAALTSFAAESGLPAARRDGLRLAVSEAVTNVVRHAYPSTRGTVTVTAELADDELWILVTDRGCGHQTPSRNPGLGFGLGIIAHECDQLVVLDRAEGGTELRMRFLLDQQR